MISVSVLTLVSDAPTPVELICAQIGERLRQERARLGYNQASFAAAVGVSKTTQFNYESGGRSPDAVYLHNAQLLGMSAAFVVSGSRPETAEDNFVSIPVLALNASAGPGSINDERAEYRATGMSVSRSWLQQRRLNAASLVVLTVRGHSMNGVLTDGDQVLVDRADTTPRTGYVYVLRQGDELLVKYCQLMPGGLLRVTSANTAFPPYDLDLSKTDDVQIVGRVVASTHEW